jgi:3-oxoadipate enol-lactonase
MEFARIGDVTLCYAVAGGAKPWLAFVNSLGTDHRCWAAVTARLEDRWNILTYDKRGHGLSDVGEAPYAMDDHVDDLQGLLDHLGIGRVALCGLSVGGMIALGLAARSPQRVANLVLCDTAARLGTIEGWNARLESVRLGGIEAVADQVLGLWFTQHYRATNPAFAGWRNMLTRSDPVGYTGTIAALRDTDYTALASDLDVPALCVVGAQDGSTPPAVVKQLAELIPGSRFEVIPNAGHQPEIEQPQALAALIARFLEENGHV